jgi:hypothetical protein
MWLWAGCGTGRAALRLPPKFNDPCQELRVFGQQLKLGTREFVEMDHPVIFDHRFSQYRSSIELVKIPTRNLSV